MTNTKPLDEGEELIVQKMSSLDIAEPEAKKLKADPASKGKKGKDKGEGEVVQVSVMCDPKLALNVRN